METHPTREQFEQWVGEIVRNPERRAELEQKISQTFSSRKAVLVLDMCGFSRTTRAHGIIAFLVMIHEMRLICAPVVAAQRGVLVKAEADNLFCLFDSVADALAAAREIHARCATANAQRPADRALHASIGIGFGDVLYIGEEDLHGDQMNIASKLGEDIAERGEILLTAAAQATLSADSVSATPLSVSISGMALDYFKVLP